MAPMMYNEKISHKRSSTDACFDTPKSQKPRLTTRHHKLHWKPVHHQHQSSTSQDDEVISHSLERSIQLALQAVGFEQASALALASFTDHVQAYMTHFLSSVRQSMLSCRRTQPIPQDYLHALQTHQLTLRSLLVHLDPPVAPPKSQVPFDLKPAVPVDQTIELPFLAVIPAQISVTTSLSHIPPNLPPSPSIHTYRATENFVKREHDPKRIREHATEEGRLGEEALRRLMNSGPDTRGEEHILTSLTRMPLRRRREMLWKNTMEAVAAVDGDYEEGRDIHDPGGMEIDGKSNGSKVHFGSAVNAERAFWRNVPSCSVPKGNEEELLARKNS